jgi:hypothetical protein
MTAPGVFMLLWMREGNGTACDCSNIAFLAGYELRQIYT